MTVTTDSCLALLEELPVLGVVKRELRRLGSPPGSAAMTALAVLDHSSAARHTDRDSCGNTADTPADTAVDTPAANDPANDAAEPLRLTALAERLQVDLSVASRQVASLIELGAVERVADARDARARRLRVTPTGHLLLQQARQAVARVLADQLERWQEPELMTLVELLGRLRTDMTGGLGGRPDPRTDAPIPAGCPPIDTAPADTARADTAPAPSWPAGESPPPQDFSPSAASLPQHSPADPSGVSLS